VAFITGLRIMAAVSVVLLAGIGVLIVTLTCHVLPIGVRDCDQDWKPTAQAVQPQRAEVAGAAQR
jgi:hypothetical protein